MACADAFCRRHHHPAGVRHADVAVGIAAACHISILHYARRTEGCRLHQCLSDGVAHPRVGNAHRSRNMEARRRILLAGCVDTRKPGHRAVKLLEPVPAQQRPWLSLATYHPWLSCHGSMVLVYRPVDGAAGACRKKSQRGTERRELHRLAEDTRCGNLYPSRCGLLRYGQDWVLRQRAGKCR